MTTASDPVVCKGENCNFFGNPDRGGYCSVCFKKYVDAQPKSEEKKEDDANKPAAGGDSDAKMADPKLPVQKKKNRCFKCRKKMALASRFTCKCGYVFCSQHRFQDE